MPPTVRPSSPGARVPPISATPRTRGTIALVPAVRNPKPTASRRRAAIAVAATTSALAGAIGLDLGGSHLPALSVAPPTHPTAPTTSAPSGPTTATSTTTTTTSPPPPGVHSALGHTYQYGYGQLAVRVTVNGSTITKVETVGLRTAESYSQQLAQHVIPLLRHEVLAAQSARVNGFSGATYTSEAYLYSLQSALDQLHVK